MSALLFLNIFAFVNFASVVKLLKRPPNTLHKVFVHSAISALEINPAADAIDHTLPSGAVGDHAFAGFGDIFFKGGAF